MSLMPKVSMIALLAAMSVSAPSYAQSLNTDAGASVDAGGANVGVDADVDVGADSGADVDASADVSTGGDADADANVSVDAGADDGDVSADADVSVDASADDDDASADTDVSVDVNATNGGGTDAGADASVDASIDAGASGTDVNAELSLSTLDGAEAGSQAVIDLVNNGGVSGDINADIDDTRVILIDAEDFAGPDARVDVAASIGANTDASANIRSGIEGNGELNTVLEAEGVDLDDIIGVQVNPDGSVEVLIADGVLNLNCDEIDFSFDGEAVAEPETIAMANSSFITAVSNCDAAAVSASIRVSGQSDAIAGNDALMADVQARGYTSADIIGATTLTENIINIYVEAE